MTSRPQSAAATSVAQATVAAAQPASTPTVSSPTPRPTASVLPTAMPRLTTDGWLETATPHLRLRYYPQSAAARDIDQVAVVAEKAYARANTVIPANGPLMVTIYLAPRVFWQGGVTYDGNTILLTYADRNYAGVELWAYLVHELVHALAGHYVHRGSEVGGLLGEGVAVYTTSGHYGVEPIQQWAAALSASNQYIPLCTLRTAWDTQQHEVAYLEGASFVDYLIRTYGSERFLQFYAHVPSPPPALRDRNLWCRNQGDLPVSGVGRPYSQLETEWRAWLQQQRPQPVDQAALQAQIRLYDLVRQYQQQRDPAARILPPPPNQWNARLHTLFAAPAITPTAVLQEAMFVAAKRNLDQHQVAQTNAILDELTGSIATNTFTGTFGLAYRGIQAALDEQAAAVRLHDRQRYQQVTLLGGPSWPGALYTDYRWTINAITLNPNAAIAEATLQAQGALPATNVPYRITLRQIPGRWQIATAEQVAVDLSLPPQSKDIAQRNGVLWPFPE